MHLKNAAVDLESGLLCDEDDITVIEPDISGVAKNGVGLLIHESLPLADLSAQSMVNVLYGKVAPRTAPHERRREWSQTEKMI